MSKNSNHPSGDDLSVSSSARSACSSHSESSWTPYIVDFLIHNDGNQEITSTSLPDAATEFSNKNSVQVQGGSLKRISNSRKRKTKEESLVDEALEDTASSPNNSPKVCGIKRLNICPTKRDEQNLTMEKSGNVLEPINDEKDERHKMRSKRELCDDHNQSSSELKRKGLRLVPVSMVLKCQLG